MELLFLNIELANYSNNNLFKLKWSGFKGKFTPFTKIM